MTLHDFLENREFVEATQGALKTTLELLMRHEMAFGILTDVSRVRFEPPLPDEIRNKFQPITLFALENYTLSTAKLDEGTLSFEAGFGAENYMSLVQVPLGALLQVAIGNRPLFLNMSVDHGTPSATPQPSENAELSPKSEPTKTARAQGSKRSMEAFLNNPQNQGLIKK
jgi:hypothetical protein